LESAIVEIDLDQYCEVEIVSSIYETKPFGYKDQDNFLNAVIKITTDFTPAELFNFLKSIERKLGRYETIKWGPREIDLDILFYNDLIYTDENITIPHKGIHERDFILVPLCEIEPDMIHPAIGKKNCEIGLPQTDSNIISKLNSNMLIK
jgi:2-amino-4-hydroxy-6-hydroxymethyldihydropteridine diphosphokinase